MQTNREYLLANNTLELPLLTRLFVFMGVLSDKIRFPLITQIFRQGNQVSTKVEQGEIVVDKVIPASFFDVKVAVRKVDITKYWIYSFEAVAVIVTAIIIYYK